MRTISLNIISLALAFIVLISNTGLFVIQHRCVQENETDYHFVKSTGEDCCEHEVACCSSGHGSETDHCSEVVDISTEKIRFKVSTCCFNVMFFNKTTTPVFQKFKVKFDIFQFPFFSLQIIDNNHTFSLFNKKNPDFSIFELPPGTISQIFLRIVSFLL